MPSNPKKPDPKNLDDLTPEEIDHRLAETLIHIDALKALWPDLTGLPTDERRKSAGRVLHNLAPALRALFDALLTRDGQETPLAAHFHVLGDADSGVDPERFEVALLARRLHRIQAEQQVQQELEKLARNLGDDILSTGERIVTPGRLALDLARSIAQGNSAYRSVLTPMFDALSKLTSRARKKASQKGGGAAKAQATA